MSTLNRVGDDTSRLGWAVPIVVTLGFAYVLFLPVSNNRVLYGTFALLGAIAAVALWVTRARVAVEAWVLAALLVVLTVYGLTRDTSNPGLIYTLLVYVLAPALYFLCSAVASPRALRLFLWAAAIVAIVGSLMLLAFIGGESGRIPQVFPQPIVDLMGYGATFRDGGSQARSYGLSSMAAIGPLWTAAIFVGKHPLLPPLPVRIAAAVLAAAASYFANRSAIVLVIGLAPVLAVAVWLIIRPRGTRIVLGARALGTALVTAAAVTVGLALTSPRIEALAPLVSLGRGVLSFIGVPTDVGKDESIRVDEQVRVISAWAANPLFGAGFGARIPDYGRTSERPWVLELQYHVLLFQVGLVGIAIILAMVMVSIVLLRRAAAADPAYVPVLVVAGTAAAAMLIANGTNPYLQAPGHMWAVFLPLAVANLMLRRSGGEWKNRSPLRRRIATDDRPAE